MRTGSSACADAARGSAPVAARSADVRRNGMERSRRPALTGARVPAPDRARERSRRIVAAQASMGSHTDTRPNAVVARRPRQAIAAVSTLASGGARLRVRRQAGQRRQHALHTLAAREPPHGTVRRNEPRKKRSGSSRRPRFEHRKALPKMQPRNGND